jgi:hypothetical protein
MPDKTDIERFISSTFRSVWDLELLLELSRSPKQSRTKQQLVSSLRASDVVVAKGIDTLLAAGLISVENDGSVRYGPASVELDGEVQRAAKLYRARPDAVRRLIIASSSSGLAAFSNAFRLKGD